MAEALRLADELERDKWHVPAVVMQAAADELRRLHAENASLIAVNEAFGKRQEWWNERMFALEQQRDALLEVVQKFLAWSETETDHSAVTFWRRVEMYREVDRSARAAIAAVEGEKT